MVFLYLSLLGLVAGAFSGLVGIGGGIILVPALVFLFGFSQQAAQGTTLALLVLPIGLLGALEYYRHGYVDLKVAALICLGFVLGNFFGAKLAIVLPTHILKQIFGGTLLVIGLKMILGF
ncbi:sulfite exporter TauE/SafE family protein [Vampirovibrio chlorellavorus]|uniref:sulfite exporter TauE/SafE family protein n=1 Tax=Vampirovibrio chlorellavorus TaxID=758823 RepID=UPI0026EEE9E7|nr:sulfite exporter TauE/SafE family protein [Vampirovibrio chlorellavorus]